MHYFHSSNLNFHSWNHHLKIRRNLIHNSIAKFINYSKKVQSNTLDPSIESETSKSHTTTNPTKFNLIQGSPKNWTTGSSPLNPPPDTKMNSQNSTSSGSHSLFLIAHISKITDTNKVEWKLGIKTNPKSWKLWRNVERDTSLSGANLKDPNKVKQLEFKCVSVLGIDRATVTHTCLPVIQGIKDPKKAYECFFEQVSQDDGLEVAAIIAKVGTIKFQEANLWHPSWITSTTFTPNSPKSLKRTRNWQLAANN